MNNSQTHHTSPLWPTGIFFLCAFLIAVACYATFENINASEKEDTNKTLVSVGQLKTNQIQSYLSERKSDAAVVSSFLTTPSAQHWLTHRGGNAPVILNQLAESVVTTYQYRGLLLLDAEANIRLNSGHSGILTEAGKAIALRAMRERSPASFKIYFGDPSTPDEPVLDTFVPVMSPDGTMAMGMIVLRNELMFLFKLLQTWPVESETAESLLVTKDGSDVLFLNELRHKKGTAARLRIPLSTDTNSFAWPAMSAVTGHFGLLEANDYRGKRILAYTLAVPDTPWSMVAKMDMEEAVAHSQRLLRVTMIIAVTLVVFTGIIVWLWWRKNKADKLANKQLQESETRYRRLHESLMDAYSMVDMSGRLLEFNQAYREMLGYSAEELQHLNYADLTPEKWHEFEARIIEEQVIPHGYSQVYEKEYIRKDGMVFPVELKTFLLRDANNRPEAMWTIVRDITERKQLEMVLHRSEASLNRAQTVGQIGSWLLDIPTNRLEWSAETYRMFGIPQHEAIDLETFVAAIHPGDRDFVLNAWGEAMAGALYDIEYRIVVGGQARWVRERAQIERDVEGRPLTGIGTVQDITDHKLAEDALRVSENRYRLLVESSPFCIHEIDLEGRLQSMNRTGLNMLGLGDVTKIRGAPYLGAVSQQDAGRVGALLRDAINNGTPSHFEFAATGDVPLYFKSCFIPIKDTNGKVLKLMGITEDITERKRAEGLLRKSSEEIEGLYNHAPCGYHSLDKDGIIRRINDTELAWLGYTRDEVIGKMKLTDLLTPAGIHIFHESFPQLKERGFVHDIETELIRKDGTVFTGLINATAIYDPSGEYVMSRSTVADITERKRIEQQLRELAAHLQTVREDEKISIAREIHDDLGGALTTMKIETYWLRTELSANKETIVFLDRVGEMSRLIDNAADVTRNIITGLRPAILDDLGLVAALEWQAAQFHKHTGIECRVNCVCEKSEDCGKELDKPHSIALFRISQEALTNVARHSGASRVDIEFHRNEEEIVMSIIDNGRGMTENRTDASIPYGIVGMRERANQLGGKINFGSMPGGGFNMTVILPLPANEEEKT